MSMTKRTAALLAALLIGSAGAASAATYTLDFDGSLDICVDGQESSTSTPCGVGTYISQNYGDQPGVDVQWDTRTVEGFQNFQFYPGGNYADLVDVAFYDLGSTLTFVAAPGFEVGLAGLSLGGFGPTNPLVRERITVTDLFDMSVLFDSGELILPGTGSPALVFHFTDSINTLGFKSSTGLQVAFLLRSATSGIDNIRYSATEISGPPPEVPLPAGGVLLLSGLAALGLARRKKG